MNDFTLNRRGVLTLAGTAAAGVLAGCAEPRSENTMEGGSSNTYDPDNVADGSVYTDIYEDVIDSVTQVRVSGIDTGLGSDGEGQGSGFLIDDTHLVTNEHVIADGTEVDLQYINGDWTSTTVVGADAYSDLAVLEAHHVPEESSPLSLSEEYPVVGQQVLAIGNPLGLEGTMTEGIVSGVDRTLETAERDFSHSNVVQTDAAVNPGNSGGPLVDLDGNVVGVINAGGGDNIGFAISAAITSRVVPSIIETGEYEHPYLGIELATVDRQIADENDLEEAAGVMVVDVVDGEPADGVLEPASISRRGEPLPIGGDVIQEIDGEEIPDQHALSRYLELQRSPGDTIEIGLLRDGTEATESLTLGARPSME
ncbi:S1C family serine protease [Natronorubrum daqingense]|uniref:Serine protease n=1 Tax=Natronorubrum daqingense TaxID=588898 RepID=A0A1N6ZTQ5_9EURY|nr:trypsin-like peptidase domain-containing protein [Natronorubrum daqingense]APX95250.1 serine protease [Natronorubrum daqingense]SIR30242.1 serine protease, S1-C subfamily, contains C-terminal PDZ domain [Natronorubrum daqingense]